MHDTSALPRILAIARNTGAPRAERVEALELLGEMRERAVIPELEDLLDDGDGRVALGAALALGRMGNSAGRELLVEALYDPEPALRDEAALTLGRMGDRAAAGALTEALGRDDVKIREQAIRMLGRLGDPSTVDALIEALVEDRTRYLTVLALGKIGDARALEPLLEVVDKDRYTDVRGYAVVALGWLGERAAIPRLVRVLAEEPEIKWTSEALVRLGAVGQAPLFGVDAVDGLGAAAAGLGSCTAKEKIIHGEFLGRTTCRTVGARASLSFQAEAPEGATVLLSGRHLLRDKGAEVGLRVAVDGVPVGRVVLGAALSEHRIETPGEVWEAGRHKVTLRLERAGAFEVDHLLVLAR
jgi:HEAT repeat protein